MKKLILLLLVSGICLASFSQVDTMAPYLKEKHLPAFSMLNQDSVEFNQNTLNADKKVIIMLFHPDCDHCEKQLQLLLTIPEVAQSAELVLCSIETLEKNKSFYKRNHLEKYPFVRVGKDYKFQFGKYYQPTTVPVLAFYNKKRDFVLINYGNTEKEMIVKALQD